jgi:hypothetical protein
MPFAIVVMSIAVETGLGVGLGDAVGVAVGLGVAVGTAVGTSVGVTVGMAVATGVAGAAARLGNVVTIWAWAFFASLDRGCQAEIGSGRKGEAATNTSSRTAMTPTIQAIDRFTIVPIGRRRNKHNASRARRDYAAWDGSGASERSCLSGWLNHRRVQSHPSS